MTILLTTILALLEHKRKMLSVVERYFCYAETWKKKWYTLSLCDSMTERGHCNINGENYQEKAQRWIYNRVRSKNFLAE